MHALQATMRSAVGRNNKALRREGWIPAVLYGKDVYNLTIQVPAREMEHLLRHHPVSKPMELHVNDAAYPVLVYEIQRHPVQGHLIHVDFKQINMNEVVHTTVPVHLAGEPEFGVPTLIRHEIEVRCLPADIPEGFVVQVDGLQAGDVILVKDLDVPPGVELQVDELDVVASILAPKAAAPEERAEETAAEQS